MTELQTPTAAAASNETIAPSRDITPRKRRHDFADVPRHWFGGRAGMTHVANGANLLFPAGERFFVRSVRRYLDVIGEDPELLKAVRGFAGQEGTHAREHERNFDMLREQGYELDRFLKIYEETAYKVIEGLSSPELRLSATAACEHFTALLGEQALRYRTLEQAHPVMRDMLLWHAAEELEHKAVAYNVLQRVNPSYALRVAGLAVAASCLGAFWLAGSTMLMRQDGVGPLKVLRELREARAEGNAQRMARDPEAESVEPSILGGVFMRGILSYLKPDFHPDNEDNYHLAERYFSESAAESPEVA